MARGKKKEENLTLEEKLKQALVPEEEWPYKVPGNWCWVKLNAINKYCQSSIDPNKNPNNTFELYSVPSSLVNYPEIVLGSEIGSSKYLVEKGDVLLCKINPRINRVWKVSKYTNNDLLASSEWIIIRNNNIITDYLMWCLRTNYFRKYMLSNVSGVGGSLMRAQPKYVMNYPVPLIPIEEQQRITACIERLFFKLDEATEKVQYVLESSESRKAAILHKAFSGELTEQWRREQGIGFNSWIEESLQMLCNSIFDGDHMPPPKSEDGIPFLVISNVNTGKLSFDNTRFVPQEYYDSLTETRKPQINDILYTLVGSYGIPVLVDCNLEFCFQRHMALLKPKINRINSKYLWYHLQSNKTYHRVSAVATGTAQLTVPIKALRGIKIVVPTLQEQEKIVSILDGVLQKEGVIKKRCKEILSQIDLLKKSILSRAFRGELGTNNPNEESAIELLKTVL